MAIIEPINEHHFYYDDGDDIYNITLINGDSIFIFADLDDYENIICQIKHENKIIEVAAMIDGGEHSRKCHVIVNNIMYIIKCHQHYHYDSCLEDIIKADVNTIESYY